MQQVNAKVLHPIGQDSRITAFFDYADLEMQNSRTTAWTCSTKAGTRRQLHRSARPVMKKPTAWPWPWPNLACPGAGSSRLRQPQKPLYRVLLRRRTDAALLYRGRLGRSCPDRPSSLADHGIWTPLLSAWLSRQPADLIPHGAPLQEPLLEDVFNGTATPVNGLDNLKNPFEDGYRQVFNTNEFVAYFQDTYRVTNTISLHAGFRPVLNTTRVSALANGETYTRTTAIAGSDSLTSSKPFLPHFSGEWRFAPGHQLYFDVAANVKVYHVASYNSGLSPFSPPQAAYLARKSVASRYSMPTDFWRSSSPTSRRATIPSAGTGSPATSQSADGLWLLESHESRTLHTSLTIFT